MNVPLELVVLDGGTIEILDWSVFNPAAKAGAHRTISDPVYLVIHPAGTLVWDAGLGDEIAQLDGPLPVDGFAMFHVADPLERQLEELGHPAASIDYLGISHFHRDHVGNVGLFTGATLLSQRDEYAAAFGPEAASHNYDPESYAALADRPVKLLDGDHDVFGDGSVLVKRFSGHTIGSQSLLVRLADAGPVLISGDLTHSLENWETKAIPQDLNFDTGESALSLDAAAELLEKEQATLWVQHDREQYKSLLATGRHT